VKNRTLVATAVIVLSILVAVPFAYAQHRRMQGRGAELGGVMMLGHLQRAKHALSLSEDQVAQIETIFRDAHTQNASYRESMRSGMQSAVQTLLRDPNDVAAAQAAIDQQTATERAMRANQLSAVSKALNVLTVDQRARLSTIVQERFARHATR
jgi:Spy/CpxP family protein refolding chaperone